MAKNEKNGEDSSTSSDFSSSVREKAKAASGVVLDAGAKLSKASYQTAASGLKTTAGIAKTTWDRHVDEDEVAILENCQIAKSILEQKESFAIDPEIFGILSNVRIKPVVGAAALGATGTSMLAFDEVLSRVTRSVFDGKYLAGGWLQDHLAGIVGPSTVTEVNRFMDTVPGSGWPGGWLHRVQHGHDLSAVAQIWSEHGSPGGIQALYHLFGRDFFTPHGIPILPAGTDQAMSFLDKTLNLSRQQAADLLSINFVEMLGGVFVLISVVRLVKQAKIWKEDRKAQRNLRRALHAAGRGDFFTASSIIDAVVAQRPADYHLQLARAIVHHRAGSQLEAHEAYVQSARLMAPMGEPTVPIGGARISNRGLAILGALATSNSLNRSQEHKVAWLDRVVGLARAGVGAFEEVAAALTDRRVVRRLESEGVLPGLDLSAALNYYLAGQVAGLSMVLPERESVLKRVSSNYDACISRVSDRRSVQTRHEEVEFLRQFGRYTLGEIETAAA